VSAKGAITKKKKMTATIHGPSQRKKSNVRSDQCRNQTNTKQSAYSFHRANSQTAQRAPETTKKGKSHCRRLERKARTNNPQRMRWFKASHGKKKFGHTFGDKQIKRSPADKIPPQNQTSEGAIIDRLIDREIVQGKRDQTI